MIQFAGNLLGGFSSIELYNQNNIQIPPSTKATPSRLFSSEAEGSGNDSAGGYISLLFR